MWIIEIFYRKFNCIIFFGEIYRKALEKRGKSETKRKEFPNKITMRKWTTQRKSPRPKLKNGKGWIYIHIKLNRKGEKYNKKHAHTHVSYINHLYLVLGSLGVVRFQTATIFTTTVVAYVEKNDSEMNCGETAEVYVSIGCRIQKKKWRQNSYKRHWNFSRRRSDWRVIHRWKWQKWPILNGQNWKWILVNPHEARNEAFSRSERP